MNADQRPEGKWGRKSRLIVAAVVLVLALAVLIPVLFLEKPVEQFPPVALPKPTSTLAEISFEEKLLAVVPEGLEYDGTFFCRDGKTVAYSTRVKGSHGELHRAILGGSIGDEKSGVELMVSLDGKTFAAVAHRGYQDSGACESVDVGAAKGERFDRVDQFTFSPDSRTTAYRAMQGSALFVVVGGTKQPSYESVESPAFSQDGSTVFYTAQRGGRRFLVVGDKTYATEFNEFHDPAVSPDGKIVAFVAVRKDSSSSLTIRNLLHKEPIRKEFVVANGTKGEEFDRIEGLRFSPDGRTVVYKAFQNPGPRGGSPAVFVVQGERKGECFAAVQNIDYSPDGKFLVYEASQGKGWFLVVNSKMGETFDGVTKPVFSPDGATFAYVAQRNRKFRVVVGERNEEEFDNIEEFRFCRDGKTPVYGAWKGGRRYVVSNGNKTEDVFVGDFDTAPRMVCSPDGRTFAYRAFKNSSCVIVGGRRFNFFAATDPVFSPDGTKVAFGSVLHSTGKSELWWRVISGPFEVESDPQAPLPAPEEGLVGYWKLDEAETTRAYDSSGRGNHGVYYHAPQASSDIPGSKFKNPASRLFVKGAPQRIEVPEAPSLSLHGALTLTAWIRPADEEREFDQGVLMKCDFVHKSHSGGYSLRLLKNGHPIFSVRPDQGGTRALVATAHRLPPEIWTHVAGVYDLATRTSRIYLNGDLVASQGSVPPPFYSNEPLWIGSDDGEGQFHGMLDELRVYRRALSEPEILALASGEGSTVQRIDDPAIRQRLKALRLEEHLKTPDQMTLVDLESAAQALLSANARSTDAVTFLGDVFTRSRNSVVRVGIARALVQEVEVGDPDRRRVAALALGYPGPFPAATIDILGDALKRTSDKGVRSAFINALGSRGPAAATALMATLSGEHTAPGEFSADCPDLAEFAAWLCMDSHAGAIDGTSVPSILPLLQAASASPDRAVRTTVAQVLGTYAGRSGEIYARVSAVFLSTLRDPDALVRKRALKSFADMLVSSPHERELYRSAIPPLLEAIKDGHAGVRFSAANALGELSAVSPAEVSQALRQAQGDSDKAVREISSYFLKSVVVPLPALDAPLKRASQVGGFGGGPFKDLAPRRGHLVGLRVTVWNTGEREFIKSLIPLYRVGEAAEQGQVHGLPSGPVQETLARPGYAIGGLVAQGSDRLDGFRALFMKITPSGLDPKDKYAGDWIGGRRPGADVYLGGDGVFVIGVSGRQGADMDAFGLVLDPTAILESAPVAVDGEGFLQRWLVLGAIPLGDLAADSDAALVKPWIPNLPELRPKQHDKVIVGDVEYDWKVENSVGFALPLGREENSVSIALSWVVSDRDIPEATLLTGADDSAIWYLNGREVQRFVGRRPVLKDQDRTTQPVALKKGANLLVAVVANAGLETGACARFVDSGGRPIQLLAGAEPPR